VARRRIATALIAVIVAASSGFAVGQIIPPRTLTKKRIVIQNIHRCQEDRSTLVGRGDWNGDKKKWTKYVCRPRAEG